MNSSIITPIKKNDEPVNHNTVLSVQAKKSICKKLKEKIDHKSLPSLLETAAYCNLILPPLFRQNISSLFEARKIHENHPQVLLHLDMAIKSFFENHAVELLMQSLEEDFDANHWSSAFLEYLSRHLKLKKIEESYVSGKIDEGKIYWKYIRKGELMYCNYDKYDSLQKPEFKMSYEKFIQFKNSGKRHGNVRITKQRFVDCFIKPKRTTAAGVIWEELKDKKIIDENGRLSPVFHLLSNEVIPLKKMASIKYHEVMSAIQSCLNNEEYCREYIPHRPHRNTKKWCMPARGTLGGRIQNVICDESCTQLWDVSIYKQLDAHRDTTYEENLSHGKLNYDHIPSTKAIKMACNLRNTSEKYKTWWTVAIPEKLHTHGETFFTSAKDQEDLGFLSNIVCYIDYIKMYPERYGLTEANSLVMALGAFRYLYKRGLDANTLIHLDNKYDFKVAYEPSIFFSEKEDCDEIDEFFVSELNKLMK